MIHLESNALKQLKNFNRLSSSQLDKLAQNLTVRVFKKDETVFDQDERARLLYLVISGVVRVSYNGHPASAGRVFWRRLFGPGLTSSIQMRRL